MSDKQPPEWMGKNRKLTPAEIEEFLGGPVVARIATIDENGVPYVTPAWQEWDGEAFWIVLPERSAWITHIKKRSERCHFVPTGQRDLYGHHGAGEG